MRFVDQTIVFDHKVEQIENHPIAVASSSDGSLIVSDSDNRTLHVISRDGVWIKKLWTHPGGEDTYDGLLSVSLMEQTCVCCTRRGSVFVMDVSS
ncbi:hypothetical protein RRG08_039915 [Elysia crispata]|uniref:Uncharacterized protein n=1 Tax=Elysia crispata TaxID=231223 RepID=A0AAE0XZY6_9GAST|nr:hypothetical protein RRG08_039915 [Elysia crispata]